MSTLTLKKKAKDAAEALDLANRVGMRFVEKKDGRYKLQMQLVEIAGADEGQTTWVDVPLCPEVYGPVKL
jgi:hypothetical protein